MRQWSVFFCFHFLCETKPAFKRGCSTGLQEREGGILQLGSKLVSFTPGSQRAGFGRLARVLRCPAARREQNSLFWRDSGRVFCFPLWFNHDLLMPFQVFFGIKESLKDLHATVYHLCPSAFPTVELRCEVRPLAFQEVGQHLRARPILQSPIWMLKMHWPC